MQVCKNTYIIRIYTQSIFCKWWRRGESNSCPKTNSYNFLRVQFLFRFPPAKHRNKAAAGSSFSYIHGQQEKHRRLTFTTKNDTFWAGVVIREEDGYLLIRQRKLIYYC